MKVFVYFNLHKKVWSVKALEGKNKGRVILHSDTLVLENPEARVSEAGRQRVLREKRKNVHAGLVGYLSDAEFPDEMEEISYNPYRFDHFFFRRSETPFHKGSKALFLGNRVWVDQSLGA